MFNQHNHRLFFVFCPTSTLLIFFFSLLFRSYFVFVFVFRFSFSFNFSFSFFVFVFVFVFFSVFFPSSPGIFRARRIYSIFGKCTRCYSSWRLYVDRYNGHLNEARRSGVRKNAIVGVAVNMMTFAEYLGYALAFWYGGKLARADELTPGDVLVVSHVAVSNVLIEKPVDNKPSHRVLPPGHWRLKLNTCRLFHATKLCASSMPK